jgi:prophage maintenance system killer protein
MTIIQVVQTTSRRLVIILCALLARNVFLAHVFINTNNRSSHFLAMCNTSFDLFNLSFASIKLNNPAANNKNGGCI